MNDEHPAIQRAGLDGLASGVVTGFRIRARHLEALADWSLWNDESPRDTLKRLAMAECWAVLLEPGVSGRADYERRVRSRLDRLLDASRRIDDDSARMASLDAVGDPPSHVPTPDLVLEADERRAELLTRARLTDGERAVFDARATLGPDATGREVAAEAGVDEDVERTLTKRLRRKLRGSFTNGSAECRTQ